MKVLKNFISHTLFHRKLLETLFHPSKAVSEPRKKEEDLGPSAQSWIVGAVDASPEDKWKQGGICTPGWGRGDQSCLEQCDSRNRQGPLCCCFLLMNLLEALSHQDEGLHQVRPGDLKSRLGGRLRLVTDDSKSREPHGRGLKTKTKSPDR